jgi:glucose 1-dehydrogenase
MRLKERVAIVTGAGRGIGASLSKGLAYEGAAIIVNYPDAAEEAEAVVAEINNAGGRSVAVQADVRDLSQHDRLVSAALHKFGRLDILINNAGIEYRQSFLTTTETQFDQTVSVNLKGPYFLSKAVAHAMIRGGQGGKIINISSCHELVPLADRSAYSITKGGLAMMTKALALELAEHHINVTSLAPGAILTEMNREGLSNPETMSRLMRSVPLNRVGSVTDCVGAAIFLASAESSYVTGSTIYVDGGLLLRKL